MPGGVNKQRLLGYFYRVPMPVSKRQVIENASDEILAGREINSAIGYGYIHENEKGEVWLSEELLTDAIDYSNARTAAAEEEAKEEARYLEFLEQQKQALYSVTTA